MLDDVGFGAASVFGGPAATPELERLAAEGLRYNRFHVDALCSPTRAALLSGRNHHQLGFGRTAEPSAGYPGYNTVWPKSAASVAEILRQNGYSTAAFGKWHNTPSWEISPAGPFDHWPTGLGFEYFYGFMGGADSQFEPRLYRNTTAVEPPAKPQAGYHLTIDIVNEAVRWLHQHDAVAPDRPFFLYLATGATHAPHQVPADWVAKYKGKFDQGWDQLRAATFERQKALGVIPANAELTTRPQKIPAWDSLPPAERRLLARQQEVYSAYLEHTDHEVGRLLQAVRDEGKADNTLILYIVGDNGGDAAAGLSGTERSTAQPYGEEGDIQTRLRHIDEIGSEDYLNNYAAGWAWASTTPFQWMKQVASHLGGTRDPLIVSWPARIRDKGGLRSQFHHVNDIAPTLYEVAGINFPGVVNGVRQLPLEGKSLAYSFDQPDAPSPHRLQYFELWGNRGIYKDGWWAGARHVAPWELYSQPEKWFQSFDADHWELYDLDRDYSQAHDLAAQNPKKLQELIAAFDAQARRNQVYPLLPIRGGNPSPARGRTLFTYRSGVDRLPAAVLPKLGDRSHRITADIVVPVGRADGVVIAQGGRFGGFSLFLRDGRPVYEINILGKYRQRVEATQVLPAGPAQVVVDVELDPEKAKPEPVVLPYQSSGLHGAVGRVYINGTQAGEARFAKFGVLEGFTETLDIGSDAGSPVSDQYDSPFSFNGKINMVNIELK
jgi:arylsulfatase